eukprot:scaffold88_cov140-Isochrysis_galbana.AAC.1
MHPKCSQLSGIQVTEDKAVHVIPPDALRCQHIDHTATVDGGVERMRRMAHVCFTTPVQRECASMRTNAGIEGCSHNVCDAGYCRAGLEGGIHAAKELTDADR